MTRREYIAGTGVALGGAFLSNACGRRKARGYLGYALVATAGENSLAVVDLTKFRLIKEVPLGASPTAVVPALSTRQSYVLTPSTGSVHAVDENLKLSGSLRLGRGVTGIRLSADDRTLLAICRDSRELVIADAATLHIRRRVKLQGEPLDIAVSATGYAAISTGARGIVELIDIASGKSAHTQLGGPTGALLFRHDGQLLLVGRPQDRCISALDVATLDVVADLPLAMRPDNLCFNFDQGQLFVSGEGMDGVAIIFPYRTLEVEQTVLAGRDPGAMACSHIPSYLFVGNASGVDVCILNVDTREVIGLVEMGGKAGYITITPDDQYALLLDAELGDMAVIHISAIRVSRDVTQEKNTSLKTAASLFTIIGVGSKPVHAAVIPRYD